MKNNVKRFSLLLAVAAIGSIAFFASCRKENPAPGSTPQPLQALVPYVPCPGVENPANPFDQAGVAHNAGLEYMLLHRGEWSCDPEQMKQALVNQAAAFACGQMSYGTPPPDCHQAAIAQFTFAANDEQTISQMIAGYGSAAGQQYAQQLADLLLNYEDSTQIITLLDAIKLLESNVMSSGLAPDELQGFLQASSIARYSICYWFQQYAQDADSGWYPCDEAPAAGGKFKDWWKKHWKEVVGTACVDALGAWHGSAAGPWGAVGMGLLESAVHVLTM